MLRSAGVTNLGEWLNLHPAVSAKFGMMPVGLLSSPEVVTQQTTFAPGATSGWHTHPGYLTATVVSGQVVRYRNRLLVADVRRPGSRSTRPAAKTFVVKNEGTTTRRRDRDVRRPGGTPTTGLRLDEPQPTTCSQ